ncbi:hypothetical protein VTK73DRAFT_3688 [Phialemonium thermophilum]|uniref:Aminoglycoside phosphotransferase domain-containing protein n=1 Tax=Phialemonium thermophilum TaxID=223376 RepID=A0ABR3WY94_9PEZI
MHILQRIKRCLTRASSSTAVTEADSAGTSAWEPQVISNEIFRSRVRRIDYDLVVKSGQCVRENEAKALELLADSAPDIPAPRLSYFRTFKPPNGIAAGDLFMSYIEGRTLRSVWPSLSEGIKQKVCKDIWDLIVKIRNVKRPPTLNPEAYYTTVDGSPFIHPLLGARNDPYPLLKDDQALRDRIYERFVACHGLSYADGKELPRMLPHSNSSVFTHGDIHPGNILIDDEARIVGLVDWESSGLLPDYGEYVWMMRPLLECDDEWQSMMDSHRIQDWDITGIMKARRVLF